MAWGRPPRFTPRTPTRKEKDAAFQAGAPLDRTVALPAKPKRPVLKLKYEQVKK